MNKCTKGEEGTCDPCTVLWPPRKNKFLGSGARILYSKRYGVAHDSRGKIGLIRGMNE